MKTTADELAKVGGAKPIPTDKPPAWLNRILEVATEINKTLEYYYKAQGVISPAEKLKADAAKPAEVVEPPKQLEQKPNNPDGGITLMKELLKVLIETLEALEKKGYGERPIGEVIAEVKMPLNMVLLGLKSFQGKVK